MTGSIETSKDFISEKSDFEIIEKKERRVVIGILADLKNFDRRLAQRETWLLSSKFEHKYLIDEWNEKWIAENKTYGDIISIDASFHGYAKGFSEKLYRWYEFVSKNYPEGTIVGKADDDFYACANLWETVMENYDDRMYFGWWHPNGPKDNDPPGDPNFPKLKTAILDRQFLEAFEFQNCKSSEGQPNCDEKNPDVRFGNNFGGQSLGGWLENIGNIHGVRMNDRMVHTNHGLVAPFRNPLKKPYCGEMVSYHKALPNLQRYLECFDQNITKTREYCHKAKDLVKYCLGKSCHHKR
ncbi:Oidioi.mRNA.OKI2018_I69.chr1.g455.t1.cds [Oikopleura dioica]|uniref:Hexosyltransferase n=1 Tax=Oikopleura dioica TaxID=34765 RepID=A0ABN7SU69_OIKDI|nr:Oidioi.mRNA.OKI2018_I69.chr1.g455.t1.cds [Oikopleura dioica]